ncbi:MAG TPA: molybdopterin molybdotransferase MoeA [Thermoplasmata archaeon]|nr:molybdopterin molybdotransferase MoeA [Thermoplasmata archaeon]
MRPFGRLLPVPVALRRVSAAARPLTRMEEIDLVEALGRVAAGRVTARTAVPPFARATWDGYAFQSRSTRGATAGRPARFRLVGEVFAEGGYAHRLGKDEAVAIATGGALPKGADAVLRFEDAQVRGRELRVSAPVRLGERLAEVGEDFPKGREIVRAGRGLTPADLGGLAITGHGRVRVWAMPRVAIVPNGNELARPGARLRPGEIHESNNAALGGLVRALGGIPLLFPPVRDSPIGIERAIRRGLAVADLVVVTGGSSVGERDFLPVVFPRIGRLLFHGIAVRPGKPTLAARAGGRLVLGMPGHPTSCLSNGFWLLGPLIRRLGHRPGPPWETRRAKLSESVDLPTAGLSTVIPLEVRGASARPTFRDSSAISSLGAANAVALWPAGRPSPRRGTWLTASILPPPLGPPTGPAPRGAAKG